MPCPIFTSPIDGMYSDAKMPSNGAGKINTSAKLDFCLLFRFLIAFNIQFIIPLTE
jgi:hypothetical protein